MFLTNEVLDEAELAIGLAHKGGRASGARSRRGAGAPGVLSQLGRVGLDLRLELGIYPAVMQLHGRFAGTAEGADRGL
jgi:hypothetical protein